MGKTKIYYGQAPQLAAHFILLLDAYEKPFYNRYNIFDQWNEAVEKVLVDSFVADIKFTGKYFIKNNPSIDKPINSGEYRKKNLI